MEGRQAESLTPTDKSRAAVTDARLLSMPGADWYVAQSYTARVRFDRWEELLALPAPNAKLPGLNGA